MLKLFLISAALVYELVSPAEVDTAMNIIRQMSHQLVSVASTHEDVPNLSICSQLCVSMTTGDSFCRAFSYDHHNKVCKTSTEPTAMVTNDVDSAISMIFDMISMSFHSTGIIKRSSDCREQYAQPVNNVTLHECFTMFSSAPNTDGEMSYNPHQKSCIPVLPQPPESLSCTSGQDTWLRYTDLSTSQIYGVPTQISTTGPYKSTPPYPCNCVWVSNVFDGSYGTHYLNSYNDKVNPYVTGDMGAEYILAGAVFVARSGCCPEVHNLHFLVALVEDDLSLYDESICSVWPGPPGYPQMTGNEKAWFPCPLKRARFFKLTVINSDADLNIAELELYGY